MGGNVGVLHEQGLEELSGPLFAARHSAAELPVDSKLQVIDLGEDKDEGVVGGLTKHARGEGLGGCQWRAV